MKNLGRNLRDRDFRADVLRLWFILFTLAMLLLAVFKDFRG